MRTQNAFNERRDKAVERTMKKLQSLQLNIREKDFILKVVDTMLFYGQDYSKDVKYMNMLIDCFRRGVCSCAEDVLMCDTIGLRKLYH